MRRECEGGGGTGSRGTACLQLRSEVGRDQGGGESKGKIVCGGFSLWRWCRERFHWRFFGEAFWLELGPHACF